MNTDEIVRLRNALRVQCSIANQLVETAERVPVSNRSSAYTMTLDCAIQANNHISVAIANLNDALAVVSSAGILRAALADATPSVDPVITALSQQQEVLRVRRTKIQDSDYSNAQHKSLAKAANWIAYAINELRGPK